MPSGQNWVNFIYINLGFVLCIVGVYLVSSLQDIKDNWPLYRCNPMYMPLSDDVEKDFTYCVQNIQTNAMGYLLQPMTFLTASITSVLGEFSEQINYIREMFNKIRNMFTDIIQSVFGVFLNLIIEFQKMIIGIKDLLGKSIGTMVAFLFIMDGSLKTMNSLWAGPTGTVVKTLGKCFHPLTKVKLLNGNILKMSELNLGDILENGSIVESTMKISNKNKPDVLYILKNKGVDNSDIYVTGSHLVYDKPQNKFIQVKDYSDAQITDIKLEWFSCLITSDHKIHLGNEIFWDWEDHFITSLVSTKRSIN